MTRSLTSNLNELDPEIERTLHLQKRIRRIIKNQNKQLQIKTLDKMANRTLKELAAPDVTYQPLCIQYPNLDADFELRSGLIHLLPKYHGLAGEDPHKHLKEFHVACYHEATRDCGGTHQAKSLSLFLARCCQGLALLSPSGICHFLE